MRVLITGKNGQLGHELMRGMPVTVSAVRALDRGELDITSREKVAAAVKAFRPDLVINGAAYTRVDQAESEPAAAFAVNRDGPEHLAAGCRDQGIPLIHVSTDFVFNGRGHAPYAPDAPVDPINVYGLSKAAGEARIRDGLPRHIIIRTAWLYSAHGHNFVKTMRRLMAERETLRVVADQVGCPTSARDLAAAIWRVVQAIAGGGDIPWGTYHYAGDGAATWHEFALEIHRLTRAFRPLCVREILPIDTGGYPTPARRPAFSVLDCSMIARLFGIRTLPWRQALAAVIADLEAGS